MAGFDPAIPLEKARPYRMIGMAGSGPAMTGMSSPHPNMLKLTLRATRGSFSADGAWSMRCPT
jgi:hypothetical protein